MTTNNRRGAYSLALWVLSAIVVGAVVVATAWVGLARTATYQDAAQRVPVVETPAPQQAPPAPQPGARGMNAIDAAGGPWVPGTTFHLTKDYPSPGVPFNVTECTATFSFADAAGNAYAVTAGHCGDEGDLVWPTTASTIDDFGTEVGRVIYTDLTLPTEVHHDVGLIAITDPARPMDFAGPAEQQALLLDNSGTAEEGIAGEKVCKIGGTTGVTCGTAGPRERQQLYNFDGGSTTTVGRTAQMCAAGGDSGGPITAKVNGHSVIVGLLSGTRNMENQVKSCGDPAALGMTIAYTPAADILRIVREVIPTAQLNPAG